MCEVTYPWSQRLRDGFFCFLPSSTYAQGHSLGVEGILTPRVYIFVFQLNMGEFSTPWSDFGLLFCIPWAL